MILITLLGDDLSNLTPVIYEYKNQITQHIIVHDDAKDDVRRAKQLHNAFNRFSKVNNLKWNSESYILDEDSKNDIVRVYHTIRARNEGEIVLHSTEGFASLALVLSNIVLSDGGKVITYDSLENELNTIHGTSLTRSKLTSRLGVNDYLDLLNYRILDVQRAQILKSRKDTVLSIFKHYDRFMILREALRSFDEKFNYAPHKDLLDLLYEINIVDESRRLIPSQKMTLEGTLLEEYTFWLCEEMGFDDIVLGAKIDFDQDEKLHDAHHVKNEFDILMTHNNRIYTIECKMQHNLEGMSLVYKYDGLIDILGEGSKAILLNVANKQMEQYNYTKISENFRPCAIRRARMNNIEVYHDTHINTIAFTNMVRNFFNLPQ